jgi:NAD(P)-dependent dehydrogenase (short-subunit alcohol dehydrogenase family)
MDSDLFDLTGKVAVVIGGGGVLGGEMASALARSGAAVAIVGRSREHTHSRAVEMRALGVDSVGVQADASSKAELERASAEILATLGHVDILVNAAGINSGTPFLEITEEEWRRILDVDLKSVFLACQVFGAEMIKSGRGGSVINVSSASSGPPLSRVFTYSVAKAGVNQITQFLAREWAPHSIRVNAILPGFIPAEQNRKLLTEERTASIMRHTPMNRFGEPWELGGITVFLASPKASSFVTGALIRVDGGFQSMTI